MILATLFSCATSKHKVISYNDIFSLESTIGFVGSDSLVVNYFDNGKIKESGKFAKSEIKYLKDLKCDLWEEYYLNGNLKSKGKFEIGKYIECSTGGYIYEYYHFKVGNWEYYFKNGQLKAKGDYEIEEKHINTSCQGGDRLMFGQINSNNWVFYNNEGNIIDASDSLIMQLETVKVPWAINFDKHYLIDPSNRKEVIMK